MLLGKDLPEQDFAKRMVDMVNQRKKHFAEERAKAKRNKPMTSHTVKNHICQTILIIQELEKPSQFDDKDVPAIGEKVAEVKEEEPEKEQEKERSKRLKRLVMQKYGTNRPEDAYDRVLWSDLKTMFDPPPHENAYFGAYHFNKRMLVWRSKQGLDMMKLSVAVGMFLETVDYYGIMEESLPNMVDDRVKELTKTQVPIYVADGLIVERKQNQADVAKMIADAIQQECENLRA
ncbi:hypothetical protein Tco_0745137 [Tanacetum coccineum]